MFDNIGDKIKTLAKPVIFLNRIFIKYCVRNAALRIFHRKMVECNSEKR